MEDLKISITDLTKKYVSMIFLDKLGIAYQRVDHEAAMTMEAMRRN